MRPRQENHTLPILSLIIPIYNGGSYIASLLQEISSQSLSGLEVIFVDDGSTDDSAAIIEAAIAAVGRQRSIAIDDVRNSEEYPSNDACRTNVDSTEIIWRLIRQENRGQGGARNTGLDAARGEWIMFCDQDDHMRRDYLRTMLENVVSADCDILMTGYDTVREDGSIIKHVPLTDTSWSRFMNVTPWGKVYRRAFLQEHSIHFYETPYGEDIYMMLLCEAAGARVHIISYVGYCWVQNALSVSHTTHRILNSSASALSLIHDAVENIQGLHLHDSELQYFLLKTAIYHVLYIAGSTERQELLEYNHDLFALLESVCPGILRNPLIRPWRPIGEQGVTRVAVWVYVMLRRLHLDGVFLSIYIRSARSDGITRSK